MSITWPERDREEVVCITETRKAQLLELVRDYRRSPYYVVLEIIVKYTDNIYQRQQRDDEAPH